MLGLESPLSSDSSNMTDWSFNGIYSDSANINGPTEASDACGSDSLAFGIDTEAGGGSDSGSLAHGVVAKVGVSGSETVTDSGVPNLVASPEKSDSDHVAESVTERNLPESALACLTSSECVTKS